LDERDELGLEAAVGVGQDLVEAGAGQRVPLPCVDKCLRLGAVFSADVVVDLVVIALGVEGRIDVAEVNGLVLDLLAEHRQVVAVVKPVHGSSGWPDMPAGGFSVASRRGLGLAGSGGTWFTAAILSR
jgi:hypothetical protein